MSLTFSQIVSNIDRNCKSNNTSYPLAYKTVDINLAMDWVYSKIFQQSGTWQFDDSNHTDYPIITTSLVSGQRDYTFTTDEQGNIILDIYKVMIADQNGHYYEVYPVDVQSQDNTQSFYDGQNTTGVPFRYDKTANGIFLDSIPSYSYANGLKVYINREGSHFATTDTTKKAGFSGLFHEYLALRPSYQYSRINNLKNMEILKRDMIEMENAIEEYYSKREKDTKMQILTKYRSPR